MEFFETKKHIRKVKDDYFVIGTRPLDPLVTIDGKHLIVDKITTKELVAPSTGSALEIQDESISLTSSATKINFVGAGVAATEPTPNEILVTISSAASSRLTLSEAFEIDGNGEITPVESDNIADNMWTLREGGNLELRSNHWRYNTGPTAFTEDISF